MIERIHTWTRWAAAKLPWDAPRFGVLWSTFAGWLPDAQAEAATQVARMLVPVDGTHPETIPYLLRAFGLPSYDSERPLTAPAGYFAALVRLRDAWATHAIAGATAMLEAELLRAGIIGTIVNLSGDTEGADFAISIPSSGAAIEFGAGAVFDDGHTFDRELTSTQVQGLAAVIRYFKPARSLFRRIDP